MAGSTISPQHHFPQNTVPDTGMALSITSAASQCRRSFQACLKLPELRADDWADNRLAEFDLWASSTGAFAGDKASLDSRLALEWETKSLVINLLAVLLECLLRCQNICVLAEGQNTSLDEVPTTQMSNAQDEKDAGDDTKDMYGEEESDGDNDGIADDKNEDSRPQDIERSFSPWSDASSSESDIDEIESSFGVLTEPLAAAKGEVAKILDHLHRLMIAIRKSGTNSRAHKADQSFNPEAYSKLRNHLTVVALARGSEKGRDLFTVDPSQLTIVQERLIMANLRRQHRYLYAHRHAQKLAAEENKKKQAFPLQTEGEWADINVNDIARLDLAPPSTGGTSHVTISKTKLMIPDPDSQPAFTATSASAVSQPIEQVSSNQVLTPSQVAKTNITATTAKVVYPQPPAKGSLHYFKCPCCSQALPDMYRQPTHWKKHLMADICPYTCIIEDCPKPDLLHKSWNDLMVHVEQDHQQCWQCLACTLPGATPTIFPSMESFLDHLRQTHEKTIREEQYSTLLSESSCPVPSGISRCPLCDSNGPADSPVLMDHIAEHLHAFALLSLPWPRSADDEQDMNDEATKNFFRDVDYFDEGSENESHRYNVSSGSERDSSGLLSWHSGSDSSEAQGISREDDDEGGGLSTFGFLENAHGTPSEFEVCPLPEVSWAPKLANEAGDAHDSIADGDLIDPKDFAVVDSQVLVQLESLLGSHKARDQSHELGTRLQIGQSLQSPDRFDPTATTLTDRILNRVIKRRNEKNRDTAKDTETLVSRLWVEGKYQDVVDHLEMELTGRYRSSSATEALSVTCLDILARSCFILTRYADAIKITWRLLSAQRQENILADTRETITLLGRILQACGRLEDAEDVLSENMPPELVSVNETESEEILMELAATKMALMKYDESAALFEQIFDVQKVALNQSDDRLVRTKQELVKVYRLTKNTEKLIQMLDLLAKSHHALRQYVDLENVRHESLALRRKSLDRYHPSVIEDLEDLATAYKGQNQLSRAEEVQKEIVQSYTASLGSTNSKTITSMRNLVLILYAQGQVLAAKQIEMKIQEIEENLTSFEDPNTAANLKNKALTYRDQDQHEKALPLLRQALDLQQSIIGPNEAATLETMDDFAQCLYELNKFQEAATIQDELSHFRAAALGSDHPLVLRDMHRYARTQEKLGFPMLAEDLMRKALERRRGILGEDHLDTLESLVDLTSLYWGRYQFGGNDHNDLWSAASIQRQVVDYYQRNHGPHERKMGQNMEKLGDMYFALYDFGAAKSFYKRAIALREQGPGSSYLQVLQIMEKLVKTHTWLVEHQSAMILQSRVVAGKKHLFGPEDNDTLRSMISLGSMYSDLELWEHAEKILTEVTETTRGKTDTNLDAMHLLAEVHRNQRQLGKAEEIWLQILRILKSEVNDSPVALLAAMRYVAAAYKEEQMWESAEKMMLEILSLESSTESQDSLYELAETYSSLGREGNEERLLEEMLKVHKHTQGPDHPDTMTCESKLAELYQRHGKSYKAIELAERLHPLFLIPGVVKMASITRIASIFTNHNRPESVLQLLTPHVDEFTKAIGTDLKDVAFSGLWLCANAYWTRRKGGLGAAFALQIIPTLEAEFGADARETILFNYSLATFYTMQGLYDAAERLLALLAVTTTVPRNPDDEILMKMKSFLESIHQTQSKSKKTGNPKTGREAEGESSGSSAGLRGSVKRFFKRAKDAK